MAPALDGEAGRLAALARRQAEFDATWQTPETLALYRQMAANAVAYKARKVIHVDLGGDTQEQLTRDRFYNTKEWA